MSKEEAFHALGSVAPLRPAIRAEVYRYWKDKRRRLGRPLARRLQAPTSANDPNHYHVFRWATLQGTCKRKAASRHTLSHFRLHRSAVLPRLQMSRADCSGQGCSICCKQAAWPQ